MPLPKLVANLEMLPEAVRPYYVSTGNGFEPHIEGVNSVNSLLANHTEVKSALGAKTAEVTRLTTELEAAQASAGASIPRGQVAVAKADADFLTAVRAHGGTAEEITAKLTEHGTLKTAVEKTVRREHLTNVAKAAGFNPEAFAVLPDLPEVFLKSETVDGKAVQKAYAKIATGENQFTETPLLEALEGLPTVKPLLSALTVATVAAPTPGAIIGQRGTGADAGPHKTTAEQEYTAQRARRSYAF